MLHLGHILAALMPYDSTGHEPALSSVVVDSREVTKGSLFVAFSGEKVDGHTYVANAFNAGAVAALVERPLPGNYTLIDTQQPVTLPLDFSKPICIVVESSLIALQKTAKAWRANFSEIRIIGITGSVGKTTTKELVYSVLKQRYNTLKSPGNRNNEIGLPLTLLALRPYHQRAVLEMGMYTPGEIALLCDIAQPDVGVLTIIGPVHMERVGSMEGIVKAKQELVEALPTDGVAILNLDDQRVMSMAAHTPAQVFTYGLDKQADLWADNIDSMGLNGVRFTLHYQGESMTVSVPLLGRHSVHTALRATAVGLVEGLGWEAIIAGLNDDSAGELRLVAVPGPHNAIIIDDTYNSSPDSAMAALNLLAELNGRHIAVLGDMLELGRLETQAHRLVGRRVADVADELVAIGQRGRIIADEALTIGMPAAHVHWVAEAPAAIPILEAMIREQDIVLIKGSLGMRMDRIVAALGRNKDF